MDEDLSVNCANKSRYYSLGIQLNILNSLSNFYSLSNNNLAHFTDDNTKIMSYILLFIILYLSLNVVVLYFLLLEKKSFIFLSGYSIKKPYFKYWNHLLKLIKILSAYYHYDRVDCIKLSLWLNKVIKTSIKYRHCLRSLNSNSQRK